MCASGVVTGKGLHLPRWSASSLLGCALRARISRWNPFARWHGGVDGGVDGRVGAPWQGGDVLRCVHCPPFQASRGGTDTECSPGIELSYVDPGTTYLGLPSNDGPSPEEVVLLDFTGTNDDR
jgi:hypothetical protein